MTTNSGLLYPAMHKFYSALNNLDQFRKGNNFFDNISYLDNFFSEYRNITFVLQKSIKHTEFNSIYEDYRNKYLSDKTSKWFVEKRNEVLKEHPFNLEKRITITLYSPITSVALPEYVFTIEDDVPYSTLIDSFKTLFAKINPIEVFFSVDFSFFEKGHDEELYDDLIRGIHNMKLFMASMKEAIKEECELCNQLEQRINEIEFHNVPKNMLFIDDFVYYAQKDLFEKSSRIELVFPESLKRTPLQGFYNFPDKGDAFDNFIKLHLFIFSGKKRLMPTFMIIYEDATFSLQSFDASVKTTIYRTINEVAKRIEPDKIRSIYYVTEMITYINGNKDYKELLEMNSNERSKHKTTELLCFYSMNKDLSFKYYCFDSNNTDTIKFTYSENKKSDDNKIAFANFLKPIRDEFKKLSINEGR